MLKKWTFEWRASSAKLPQCFAPPLLRNWIHFISTECAAFRRQDKTGSSRSTSRPSVFDSKHQIKLDITIFSNRFRARPERETRILLRPECFFSTSFLSLIDAGTQQPRLVKENVVLIAKVNTKWNKNKEFNYGSLDMASQDEMDSSNFCDTTHRLIRES